MVSRIFLGLNTLIWLPYGLYCLFDPGYLAEAAGVVGSSATGTTELRAMYGGLQASIGVWAAYAVMNPAAERGALTALLVLPAGLATARIAGVVLDGGVETYTVGALGLEIGLAGIAAVLLRRADA